MSELSSRAQAALDAFCGAASWEARARLLMQWGDALEPLDDDQRNENSRVDGCESRVWLVGERREGHWYFRAASEARLLRGLLAVLLARVAGLDDAQLGELDLNDWFTRLGLSRQLSPSRTNGLNAVLQRMRTIASGKIADSD